MYEDKTLPFSASPALEHFMTILWPCVLQNYGVLRLFKPLIKWFSTFSGTWTMFFERNSRKNSHFVLMISWTVEVTIFRNVLSSI